MDLNSSNLDPPLILILHDLIIRGARWGTGLGGIWSLQGVGEVSVLSWEDRAASAANFILAAVCCLFICSKEEAPLQQPLVNTVYTTPPTSSLAVSMWQITAPNSALLQRSPGIKCAQFIEHVEMFSNVLVSSAEVSVWGCSSYWTSSNPSLTYRSGVFLEMATAISVDCLFPLAARIQHDSVYSNVASRQKTLHQ